MMKKVRPCGRPFEEKIRTNWVNGLENIHHRFTNEEIKQQLKDKVSAHLIAKIENLTKNAGLGTASRPGDDIRNLLLTLKDYIDLPSVRASAASYLEIWLSNMSLKSSAKDLCLAIAKVNSASVS